MPRRRMKAPVPEEPDTLLCGECGLAYHGPHKGDIHHPYRDTHPGYKSSQGLCNSRTCIRSQSRKMAEHMRVRSHKHGIERPDSYWRQYAKDEEAETEARLRAGTAQLGLPAQDIVEDWGSKEPNPDNIVAATAFEPLQPPIDFEASDE